VGLLLATSGGLWAADWVQKAQNPSWWPYVDATTIPTIAALNPNYAGEPLGNVPGYWPRYISSGVFANGKYYVVAGWGPATYAFGGLTWPDNRQSGLDIYDPATDTWSSSRWDGSTYSGPRGLIANTDLPLGTDFKAWINYAAQMVEYEANGGLGSGSTGSAKLFMIWDVTGGTQRELRYIWKYDEWSPTLEGLITEVSFYVYDPYWRKVKTLYTGSPGQWLNENRRQLNGFWKWNDAEPFTADLLTKLLNGELYVQVHTDLYPDGELAGPFVINPNWDPDRKPTESYGSYCSTNAAQAYDRNGDGIKEIYVVPGYPHWDGTIAIYDPADDTWVPSAHGGNSGQRRCISALYQGKMFAIGGSGGTRVTIYDIDKDTWIPANEALSYTVERAWSGVVGDTLYIFGGGNNKILKYNLAQAIANPLTTDIVDTGDLLPVPLNYPAGGVYNGKLYIVGGQNPTTGEFYANLWEYDPAAPAGSRLKDLGKPFPMPIVGAAAAVDQDTGKLYVGGAFGKKTAGGAQINDSVLYVLDLAGGPTICRGDLNCDGKIDFGDINPFVLRLSNPASYFNQYPNCPNENGDINANGVVGFDDINPFVGLLSSGQLPIPCP